MKTTTSLAVPLAVGLALTAAAVAPASAATAPRTYQGSAAPAEVVLGNKDNYRTVAVRSGDMIRVELKGSRSAGSVWAWDFPASSDFAVLRPAGVGQSGNGDAWGDFRALDKGTAEINSTEQCYPEAGWLCPAVIIPWKVTIVVQ
ncbi:hypothetical protein AF335_24860 [Streptomyces eurocidicus]|uniref:Proteinase inhibitor I42 chagasin domain-containing protein n=1 Tax=Streptomyces eurocidicus TaxID=66423 RepID=A0A2N8NR80_STREU|nr:hypothetical protein [Streptomyces eurocidicus]MBB5117066.1 hypothetical protein [Streptomyces eurocidicus]MBF6052637.1 hypothetical protein [Streptomyces eurocidicus]PNE31274.1 hypothetical protein AF335_24860 [Streptomyces eurocidicus]